MSNFNVLVSQIYFVKKQLTTAASQDYRVEDLYNGSRKIAEMYQDCQPTAKQHELCMLCIRHIHEIIHLMNSGYELRASFRPIVEYQKKLTIFKGCCVPQPTPIGLSAYFNQRLCESKTDDLFELLVRQSVELKSL
jgi:hypothetical protein